MGGRRFARCGQSTIDTIRRCRLFAIPTAAAHFTAVLTPPTSTITKFYWTEISVFLHAKEPCSQDRNPVFCTCLADGRQTPSSVLMAPMFLNLAGTTQLGE